MSEPGSIAIAKYRIKGILARRTMLLRPMIGFAFAFGLSGIPLAAQDSCEPVLDAMNKIYTTPTHLYNTMDGNRQNEFIYAGGNVYTNHGGKWSRSELTLQQVRNLDEKNRQNSKTTCRYLRDEPVDGEAAAVYSTHAERSDLKIKSDGELRISKTSRLPLRQEEDVDAGEGIKKHHSTRFDYSNVKAPL